MGKVIVDISMSLDGFIAGPNVNLEHPLGIGGERLHHWFFDAKTPEDEAIMAEVAASSGAVILGRRMYDTAIDEGWGGVSPFNVPAFVLTSRPAPEKVVEGFRFLTMSIETALSEAKAVAEDKNIWIIGGANLIQQYLKAGLVDELRLHIPPVLFGKGTRLFEDDGAGFELERIKQSETPAATHLSYRIKSQTKD